MMAQDTLYGHFDSRICRGCSKAGKPTKHVRAYKEDPAAPVPEGMIPQWQLWVCTRCGYADNLTGSSQIVFPPKG